MSALRTVTQSYRLALYWLSLVRAAIAGVTIFRHGVVEANSSNTSGLKLSDEGSLYPLELVVSATPVSLQGSARSIERWKETVATAARQRLNQTVDFVWFERRPLSIVIYYFPPAPMIGDIDNIVKPIMDALVRVAYLSDNDVERVISQRFEPEIAYEFTNPSEQLATALGAERPVVYIRIDDDLSWRRL